MIGAKLPQAFCWTRIGFEAGQGLQSILERKEAERHANHGTFFWGIGNAIGPALSELLSECANPEVIFSRIKSRPRNEDSHPECVVAWTRADGIDGEPFELPRCTLITSRLSQAAGKRAHYALVCYSDKPLTEWIDEAEFAPSDVENFVSGKPVGASQVTAVVRHRECNQASTRTYRVALRARLAPPYFLRLREPVPIRRLTRDKDWDASVSRAWNKARRASLGF